MEKAQEAAGWWIGMGNWHLGTPDLPFGDSRVCRISAALLKGAWYGLDFTEEETELLGDGKSQGFGGRGRETLGSSQAKPCRGRSDKGAGALVYVSSGEAPAWAAGSCRQTEEFPISPAFTASSSGFPSEV